VIAVNTSLLSADKLLGSLKKAVTLKMWRYNLKLIGQCV
ncbi:MAG: hypothetical protein ACI9YH_000713, partial [Colwellia sp.]